MTSPWTEAELQSLLRVALRCARCRPGLGWRTQLSQLYEVGTGGVYYETDRHELVRWCAAEFDVSEATALTQLFMAGQLSSTSFVALRGTECTLALPHDLLVHVLKHVPSRTLVRCGLVSKSFRQAVLDDAPWAVRPRGDDPRRRSGETWKGDTVIILEPSSLYEEYSDEGDVGDEDRYIGSTGKVKAKADGRFLVRFSDGNERWFSSSVVERQKKSNVPLTSDDAYQAPQGQHFATHRENICTTIALKEVRVEQKSTDSILIDEIGVQALATALYEELFQVVEPGPPPFSFDMITRPTPPCFQAARLHLRRKAAFAFAELVEADSVELLQAAFQAAMHRQRPVHEHDEEDADDAEIPYPIVGSRDLAFSHASRFLRGFPAGDLRWGSVVGRHPQQGRDRLLQQVVQRASQVVALDSELAVVTRLARRAGVVRFTRHATSRAWRMILEHATAVLLRVCMELRAQHLDAGHVVDDHELPHQQGDEEAEADIDSNEDTSMPCAACSSSRLAAAAAAAHEDTSSDEESSTDESMSDLSEEEAATDDDDVEEEDDADVRWDAEASEWVILPSSACIIEAVAWLRTTKRAQQRPQLYG